MPGHYGKMKKGKKVKGKRKKLDMDKDGKLTKKDFAMLRNKKKGRASYNRATGGNLKAPSKKVGNKRRASFCARMKGMKKKLTSKKTANDPNSRINKALRAWNC